MKEYLSKANTPDLSKGEEVSTVAQSAPILIWAYVV